MKFVPRIKRHNFNGIGGSNMLYNRVKEHVVNDRKKMYKRGSQWVVVSAFALALGGVALTQLQPVNAAETDTHLVVQPVTLTQDGPVSQPAAAQTEPASAVKNTQPVATANAAKANGEASPAAAQQQATAAYQAASQAANANTSMPASSGMTEAEWQAQQAKYDQAKSDAAVSEAAEKQKTSEAEASYANSLASQAAAQKQQDHAFRARTTAKGRIRRNIAHRFKPCGHPDESRADVFRTAGKSCIRFRHGARHGASAVFAGRTPFRRQPQYPRLYYRRTRRQRNPRVEQCQRFRRSPARFLRNARLL